MSLFPKEKNHYFYKSLKNQSIKNMKSLVKKKVETKKTTSKKTAQCCAKTSKTVVGCHD